MIIGAMKIVYDIQEIFFFFWANIFYLNVLDLKQFCLGDIGF